MKPDIAHPISLDAFPLYPFARTFFLTRGTGKGPEYSVSNEDSRFFPGVKIPMVRMGDVYNRNFFGVTNQVQA
jgi:hypothetical protein